MDEVILVLGGGGARGLAHIGALRALEEHEVRVRAISACSIGGIVGAFYAAGEPVDEMERIARGIRYETLLSFGELGGLVGGAGLARLLAEHLPERFDQLELPLLLTTVDVQKGELVVLGEGPLIPALRATSALPGLIAPVEHLGRVLVDGGMLNNLPVDLARTQGPVPVVAVDVAAAPDRELRFHDDRGLWARMKDVLQPQRALTVELFMKSFDVPQSLVTKMRLAMAPPDLLIRPPLDKDFGVEQFARVDEAIEIGYAAADEALAGLRRSDLRRAQGERDDDGGGHDGGHDGDHDGDHDGWDHDDRRDQRDAHPQQGDDEGERGQGQRRVTTTRL